MGIKHDDVKATGEKGFASEWNKNHVVDGDIDMVQNQLLNNVIENVVAFPAGPVEGLAVYRTDLNSYHIYNGATWDEMKIASTKTSYWSAPGHQFSCTNPETVDVSLDGSGNYNINVVTEVNCAVVGIPNGAVVTGVVVYGDADAQEEIWDLRRKTIALQNTTAIMASALVNTEDITIANATIDNSLYAYYFVIEGSDAGDTYFGARITYTTLYD